MPGTAGEEKTVACIADQFRAGGAMPGTPDGTCFQRVALIGTTPSPSPLTIRRGAARRQFHAKDDFVLWTKREVAEAAMRATRSFRSSARSPR